MFHCNGWCFPWTLSVVAGTHVCLRSVRAKAMYDAIADHKVTHLSGAPFVMSALLNAAESERRSFEQTVAFNHAAAPPPEAVLGAMAEAGFELTHLYGLTETYGPATINEWHEEWDRLPPDERLSKRARQGVRYVALEGLDVLDPETMERVPADGETIGEVMFRGNIVMKGYLKNKKATKEAFAGGWFHSGDLVRMDADGYVWVVDRKKDMIISGGENIYCAEVENVLAGHPRIVEAAVIGRADEKWGEVPIAIAAVTEGHLRIEELGEYLTERLARYKHPKALEIVDALPRNPAGKVLKTELRLRYGADGDSENRSASKGATTREESERG
jgi:fatty-acyl-CoA synthase